MAKWAQKLCPSDSPGASAQIETRMGATPVVKGDPQTAETAGISWGVETVPPAQGPNLLSSRLCA